MRRFGIFLLLSLLLHLLFGLWGGIALGDRTASTANPPIIMMAYTPKSVPAAPLRTATTVRTPNTETPIAAAIPTIPATPITHPSLDTPAESAPIDQAPPDFADKKPFDTSPLLLAPQSARLKLEVRLRYRSIGPNLAGELNWQRSAEEYQLKLETLPEPEMRSDFRILRQSQGRLLVGGLAPVRYTEQRGKKAEVATNFQYTNPAAPATEPYISFSRVTDRLPLAPGVQDELSILMQIGVLLRGHPEWVSQPGNTFEIPVTSTRDAQNYQFTFIGEEMLESRLGTRRCWHVRSQPLADRYATQIEVWIAPEEDFLPMKIRLSSGEGISIETLTQEIVRQQNP